MDGQNALALVLKAPSGSTVAIPSMFVFLDNTSFLSMTFEAALRKHITLYFEAQELEIYPQGPVEPTILSWLGFLTLAKKETAHYIEWLQNPDDSDSPQFIQVCTDRGANAKGYVTSSGFVVIKGSQISKNCTPGCPDKIKSLRHKLSDLINQDGYLNSSISFDSIEDATHFVLGKSCSEDGSWHETDDLSDIKAIGTIIHAEP